MPPSWRILFAGLSLSLATACASSSGSRASTPTPIPSPTTTALPTPQPTASPTPTTGLPLHLRPAVALSACPDEADFNQLDLLALALDQAGTTREAFRFDPTDAAAVGFPADDLVLPDFERHHGDPAAAHCYGRALAETVDQLTASDYPLSRLLAEMSERVGRPVDASVAPDLWLTDRGRNNLVAAISNLVVAGGGEAFSDVRAQDLATEADELPKQLQENLVPVVQAIARAVTLHAEAFANLDPAGRQHFLDFGASLLYPRADGEVFDITAAPVRDVVAGADWQPRLYDAAWGIALAIDQVRDALVPFAGTTGFDFRAETPVGWVIVQDGASQLRAPGMDIWDEPIALLVDTGGSDDYRIPAGANQGADNPVSVVIDLAGFDVYGYPEVGSELDGPRLVSDAAGRRAATETDGPISLSNEARQGAGRLGIGMLVDLGDSDDRYTTLRLGQGYASFGVGLLFDEAGNDVYLGEAGVQGSANVGLALLLDTEGDDRYEAYRGCQGFGWVRSAGWLVDTRGSDYYSADVGEPGAGGDPLYGSPQLPGQANESFCQGAGLGLRALSQDVFWSGGLGLLRDRTGEDRYEASVFAQGVGFYYGAGVLADGDGSDAFDARWYAQGSAAHFGLGLLGDAGDGNDNYNERGGAVNMVLGAAHDFSVGVLSSGGGNDFYTAGDHSLGAGSCNSAGLFVDNGGNDRYQAGSERTMGTAALTDACADLGGVRLEVPTRGFFLEGAGIDDYTRGEAEEIDPGDGESWTQPATEGRLEEAGAVDRDTGITTIRPED